MLRYGIFVNNNFILYFIQLKPRAYTAVVVAAMLAAALGLLFYSVSVRSYILGGGNNFADVAHPSIRRTLPWSRHATVPTTTSSKIITERAAESTTTDADIRNHPMRIAYQGEPGAYSEKAAKELLGDRILTMGHKVREGGNKLTALTALQSLAR